MTCGSRDMRWKCDEQGCFLTMSVPDLTVFDDCFSGKIGMGDLDAWVEVNDHYLFFELKHPGVKLPTGQRIMFERLTRRPDFTVVVIEARMPGWHIKSAVLFKGGVAQNLDITSLSELKNKVAAWGVRVKQ